MRLKTDMLQDELAKQNLAGFIVPKTDEYQNEYNAAYAERLSWVSGFTGSAGLGIVGLESAALFVDGRYTLQARDEVDTNLYSVRDLADSAINDWLKDSFKTDARLGYDPTLHTLSSLAVFQNSCEQYGIKLVALDKNPIDQCWSGQPDRPTSKVVEQPLCFAGESSQDKCVRLTDYLKEKKSDALVITMPDCIAWLLNVRAEDVPHVPVPLSWAVLYVDGSVDWFIDENRVDLAESKESREHIRIEPESHFHNCLKKIACENNRVMLDDSMTCLQVRDLLISGGAELVNGNPVFEQKACKNSRELEGTQSAHIRDGVALVNFLAWFDETAITDTLTEMDIVEKIQSLRQAQDYFQGASFDTISGAGSNGAIIHYRVNEKTNKRLEKGSLFLVDSGGQYLDGTTDITRTMSIGTPTNTQKEHFTRVLKGHIAIATCIFPQGTSGHQIDCLARNALWQVGLDYGHGTGHGVGSYLGVHEGPQRIAPWPNAVALQPGMILSNEPGYYLEGEYGIRIENLITVCESQQYPNFLEFETLSLAPIARNLIDTTLLSEVELNWVNEYHRRVFNTLQSMVSGDVLSWLTEATQPLS